MPANFVLKALVSNIIVFDTSIFIHQLRTGRYQQRLQDVVGLVRTSAVVLSELWRGASSSDEIKFLRSVEKNHPVLVPTAQNWVESGKVLGRIRSQMGYSRDKLRDLHFDLLITLTCRSHGARLITSNRSDFEVIASYIPVHLEIWS